MSGCEGCWATQKAQEAELQSTINKAKQYAIEQQKTIFIYKLPESGFAFMEETAARQNGIYPVQVVSQY